MPDALVVQMELAPPPTEPVPADEQLKAAIGIGTILKRSSCGKATLLVVDGNVEGRRTELVVATFDPEYVLGDRKQGRWSIMPVEQAAGENAAEFGACVTDAGRPAVFVTLTATTYAVLVHVADHAAEVDRGPRPAGAKVSLKGGKRLELRVGDTVKQLAWPAAR